MLPQSEERFSPEMRGEICAEHLGRYAWAWSWLKPDDSLLDIASGEGYGASILSGIAGHTLGVDISPECVAHAQERYAGRKLDFSVGAMEAIPADDRAFDVAVSFETIEHCEDTGKALDEILRVLRPDGVFIVSTPDKLEYSDKTGHKNRFHLNEMYRDEFEDALHSRFRSVALFGQRVLRGSLIYPAGPLSDSLTLTSWNGKSVHSSRTLPAPPLYWIAVASNGGRISYAPAGFHMES